VLIHFHDIFLPDTYPEAWGRRGYNEQIAVGALLQGGAYALVFASHYVTRCTGLLAGTVIDRLPRAPGGFQASLWLRKSSSGNRAPGNTGALSISAAGPAAVPNGV
jgi:hypothetical protein